MKTRGTVRTFVTKSGDTWEWVETPEFVKALEIYWYTINLNNERN